MDDSLLDDLHNEKNPRSDQKDMDEAYPGEDKYEIVDDEPLKGRAFEITQILKGHKIHSGDAMKESYRLSTFEKFPADVPVIVNKLAASGFLYIGTEDKVICYCCGKYVDHWKEGDDPAEAMWHNPDCSILQGMQPNARQITSRPVYHQCDNSTGNAIPSTSRRPLAGQSSRNDSGFDSPASLTTSQNTPGELCNMKTIALAPAKPASENVQDRFAKNAKIVQVGKSPKFQDFQQEFVMSGDGLAHFNNLRITDQQKGVKRNNQKSNSKSSRELQLQLNTSQNSMQKAFISPTLSSDSDDGDFKYSVALSTSQKHSYRTEMDLLNEEDRRKTFHCWSHNSLVVNPTTLAKSGFFLVNNTLVQCYYCGVEIVYWGEHEVEKTHRIHSPNCVMVKKSGDTHSTALESTCSAVLADSDATCEQNQDPFHDSSCNLRPIHPHMDSYEERIQTFDRNWPELETTVSIKEIAKSGFFYSGYKDRVTCWYCNGKLQNWNSLADDPFAEHAKLNSSCEYIRKLKGLEFVSNQLSTSYDGKRRSMDSLGLLTETTEYPQISSAENEDVQSELISSVNSTSSSEAANMSGALASPECYQPPPAEPRESGSSRKTAGNNFLNCKVCEEETATVVVFPCRHLSFCISCSRISESCPICHCTVTDSRHYP